MQKRWNRLVYKNFGTTALVLLLLVCAGPVSAEWYKDYEAAMEFIKKGQHGSAIPKLQAAISQKNDEGTNIKFYGMKFGDYFPHYYLGMAYFSQKNYDAALKEFEASERFGAIQRKSELYDRLSSVRTLARAQLVVKQPEIASNIPTTPPPVIPDNQETKIETKPETKPEEKPVEIAQTPELKPEVIQKDPDNTKTIQPSVKENTVVKPEIKETKPLPPPIKLPSDTGPEMLKAMVRNAARKYFEGDYDSTISILNGVVQIAPNDASVQFLLGCSYASKYLLSGSQNQQFYQNASLAFQRLRKNNPQYKPGNRSYFSPAILNIFDKTS